MDRSRPYVVGHVAVSLEGATSGFQPDMAKFYELAHTWAEDVTLTGADTILSQETALREAPRPGPAEAGPLLAVVDGRCRVRHWDALREVGHWSDVVALRCASTPRAGAALVDEIVVGASRVDLAAALRALEERRGVEVVRVDSGGGLLGALLDAELVDELSLLVHPCLVGPAHQRRWHGQAVIPKMAVTGCKVLDGLVWLRYRVGQEPPPVSLSGVPERPTQGRVANRGG